MCDKDANGSIETTARALPGAAAVGSSGAVRARQ
jgi:hypothetical protein